MDHTPLVTYALACFTILVFLIRIYRNRAKVDTIPTIGPSGVLTSYIMAFKFFFRAHGIIEEGYSRYKGRAFKVANLKNWHVIVSGPKLIEELRKAPDDRLSSLDAINDSLNVERIMGHGMHHNPYHIGIVRSQLTRNLAGRFSDIRDEIQVSFDEVIPSAKEGEWVIVPAFDAIAKIVCRTSNRLFVGLPLCRDTDWIALNVQFTIDIFVTATMINLLPRFMTPLVVNFIMNIPGSIDRGMNHLRSIIEERLRCIEDCGDDWTEKPQDLLSWILDEARGEERSIRNVSKRILAVNAAAIHTTSMGFTLALYYLAANPQFVQPLREEVEAVLEKEGWSKVSMSKMRKIDSFLKETQRIDGQGCTSMSRKVIKDFIFSDGTLVPAGYTISVAANPMHRDKEFYENPVVFKPFRFSDMVEGDGVGRHQLVSTNSQYVVFGDGKHACPGRFFAGNELKALLAHVVLTYDVKMEDEGVMPPHVYFGTATAPNKDAKVMFRRRAGH